MAQTWSIVLFIGVSRRTMLDRTTPVIHEPICAGSLGTITQASYARSENRFTNNLHYSFSVANEAHTNVRCRKYTHSRV
jgi:hypothetical protein